MRYGANDFLGEVLLELGSHPLDDEAEWYTLHGHQESNLHTVRIKNTNCKPDIHTYTQRYKQLFPQP